MEPSPLHAGVYRAMDELRPMRGRHASHAEQSRRLAAKDVGRLVSKVRPTSSPDLFDAEELKRQMHANTRTHVHSGSSWSEIRIDLKCHLDHSHVDEIYLLKEVQAHPAEPAKPTGYVLEHRGTFAHPTLRRRGRHETCLVDGWLTLGELGIDESGIFAAESCAKCGNALEEKHKCGEV